MASSLDPALRAGLVSELSSIVGRSDSGRKAATWISAAASLSGGETFALTDVARAAGADCTSRMLRQLLDAGTWDEDAIAARLREVASPDDTSALLLKVETVVDSTGRPTYDIASVQSITPFGPVPIAWSRVWQPQESDPDDRAEVSLAEIKLVEDLLKQIPEQYLSDSQAPVVTGDFSLGISPPVRRVLESRGLEYVMDVESFDAPHFTDVVLDTHPEGRRRQVRTTAEMLPRPLDGDRAGAVARVAGSDEWAVSVRRGDEDRVALVRPRILGDGPLLATRSRARVRELAHLAAGCALLEPARSLNVLAFRHKSDLGWRRHAMLMSLGAVWSELASAGTRVVAG